MSVLPKIYFDSERDHWSEYTRARAAVAEVEAAVAALEREKAIVVAMAEMVARFADRLGGLGEFLLTSPRVVVVVRDDEDGRRGRGGPGQAAAGGAGPASRRRWGRKKKRRRRCGST